GGAAHQGGDGLVVRGGADGLELRRQRGGALGLDRGFVQEAAVQRGDLRGIAGGGVAARHVVLHQPAHPRLGQVAQDEEGAVHGAVGGDPGGARPVAAHVGEEVVARRHARVHAGGVDAPAAVAGGVGGGGGRARGGGVAEQRHQVAVGVEARSEEHT